MNRVNAVMPHWMFRLIVRQDATGSSLPNSRIEVCPPELWPSSLGWKSRVRRWLQGSRWLPARARPVNRLALVKQEFRDAAASVPPALLQGLGDNIERARSLREFWHLRSPLYNALAMGLSQADADRCLLGLNRHFPTRAPRVGMGSLNA